jgi:hypothetical protein
VIPSRMAVRMVEATSSVGVTIPPSRKIELHPLQIRGASIEYLPHERSREICRLVVK